MKKRSFMVLISICLLFSGLNNVSAKSLLATVTVGLTGQTVWNYTLTNSELNTSNNWLTDFYLPINAPVTDIQTSNGWQIDTDNSTYIQWSNIEASPYPDDIAPLSSASGFSFTSVATGSPVQYTLSSWDHEMNSDGPNLVSNVLAPDVSTAVPEPNTITSFSIGILSLVLLTVRRNLKRKQVS